MTSDSSSPLGRLDLGSTTAAPFFLSSFAWNFALGMSYMLVPLYASSLNMPGTRIGMLVALPVMLQIGFSLLGGALSDRVGGKRLATVSCIMTCIAGLTFAVSSSFLSMLAAQLMMSISRGMFWPATWSLASQLPGNSGVQMGRLNSATNAGQIAGTAASGFIITAVGFHWGFASMTAVGLIALVLNQMFRSAPAMPSTPAAPILSTYRVLLGKRAVRYGIVCAFISALPLSLSFSFYPILLIKHGLDSDTTGTLMSLRPVGAIAIGFIAGYFLKNVRGIGAPLVSAMVVGFSVVLSAAMSDPLLIGICMFALGAGSSIMTLYFQMLISTVSTAEMRGSAMALGGLGWGISHLGTPLAMGLLKDYIGLHLAFYCMGAFALMYGLALIPLQRRAFRTK